MAKKKKPTTVKEWLEANMDKYDDYNKCRMACTKSTKRDPSTVRKYMKRMWTKPIADNRVASRTPGRNIAGRGVTEEPSPEDIIDKKAFLGSVDLVAQVINYLDDVVKDAYIENEKLRRKFGIGNDKWRDIVRLPVMAGRNLAYNDRDGRKTTVWSSKKGIEAAKATISMARYDK